MSDLLALCERTVQRALGRGADAVEAYGVDGREIEVFLERNDVKLGKAQGRSGIGLRVLRGQGQGFASTNSLEEEKVAAMMEQAISLATKAPKDPHVTLPDGGRVRPLEGLYDEAAESFGAEEALDRGTEMLRAARQYDPRITVDSGTFNAAVGERAIFNSQGVEAQERTSLFTYFLLAFSRENNEVGSFDFLVEGTHQVADVQTEALGRRLAERIIRAIGPQRTESFRGAIVLNPYTVDTLLAGLLAAAVNANNVQKGMSRLAGRVGEPVATALLQVHDDGSLPGGLGSSAFDREGVPHRPLALVEEGRLQAFLHNAYTAAKAESETTGHAAGDQRTVPAIGPTNLSLAPGDRPRDGLIEEIDHGLLVNRFSGWPQAVSGDFSGVVKGGYRIEKGEVVHPVKETLIAGNIFELLHNLSGVSREVEEVFSHRLPYVRFDDVSITGG